MNKKITDSQLLYHYTSQKGLLDIIQSKELWASDMQFLNDHKEFHLAIELLIEKLNKGKVKNIEAVNALKIIENYVCKHGLFCCSFSANDDSLDLWRGYSKNSFGFAIGFEKLQLASLGQKYNFELNRCRYSKKESNEILSEMFVQYSEANPGGKVLERDKLIELIAMKICKYAPLLKTKAFQNEKEWRLYINPFHLLGRNKKQINFKPGKSCPIPYFALPFDLKIIKKIVVGPTIESELSKESVCKLLEYHIPNNKIEVINSSIPYRFW